MANGIDLLIARGPPPIDFASGIGDLPKAYWEGLNQAHTQELRDAYQGGLPMKGGNLDTEQILKTFLTKSGAPGVIPALPALQQQTNIRESNDTNRRLYPQVFGDQPAPSQPSGGPVTGRVISAPQSQSPTGYTGGNNGMTTIDSVLSQKMADSDPRYGPTKLRIAADLRVDPDQPLTPAQLDRITQGLAARPNLGGAAAPPAQFQQRFPQTAGQPFTLPNPAAPVTPNASPRADPTLGGIVPAVFRGDFQAAFDFFTQDAQARGARGDKEGEKASLMRAEAIKEGISQYRKSGLEVSKELTTKSVGPLIDDASAGFKETKGLASGIKISHDLMDQLNRKGGIFAGQWANQELALAKGVKAIATALGIDYDASKIASTEAFRSLVGKKVAQTVKSFGSGTSITDSDRQYAAQMEAGDIKLDEKSMRRILVITDKINRETIKEHNDRIDELARTQPGIANNLQNYKVKMPAQNIMFQAYDAVYHGADPNAVRAELRKHGIKNPMGL